MSLSTHYLGVIPALLDAGVEALRGRWKRALSVLAVPLAAAFVLAPVLLPGISEKAGCAPQAHYDSGADFLVGLARSALCPGGMSLMAALALAAVGFARRGMFVLPAWVASFVGTVVVLGFFIPIEVRYCLPVLPPLLAAVAAGMVALASHRVKAIRIAGVAAAVLVLAGIAYPLPTYWGAAFDLAPAQRIHHDLAHVEFSLSEHLAAAASGDNAHLPIFLAMRGPEHFRVALELKHGNYPEDATLVVEGDVTTLRLPGRALYQLDMPDRPPGRVWEPPIPLPPGSRYLVLVERRGKSAFDRPPGCAVEVGDEHAELWMCEAGGSRPEAGGRRAWGDEGMGAWGKAWRDEGLGSGLGAWGARPMGPMGSSLALGHCMGLVP